MVIWKIFIYNAKEIWEFVIVRLLSHIGSTNSVEAAIEPLRPELDPGTPSAMFCKASKCF